jgi:hypothetical protein
VSAGGREATSCSSIDWEIERGLTRGRIRTTRKASALQWFRQLSEVLETKSATWSHARF